MSDARYDQYREALRLGHVATQHDHHDAAAASNCSCWVAT